MVTPNESADLKSLAPQSPATRREFLVTSLATGFALAVQPVSAQTITTDTSGLVGGEVEIPTADGGIPAYRAMPAGPGTFPVVLVVQEIFGVHEHIRDVCRRLAKEGYLAVAPELFARQGDVSKLAKIEDILPIVAQVPDAQVMSDLDATVAWAGGSGHGDSARLGITGFCWGGRITWLYSAHNPRLKAGVAWYGRLEGATTGQQPRHPLELAANLHAPVLGLYAGQDQGIPLESVERMRAALRSTTSKSSIIVYPEAPHGFHADYRPSYRPDDARAGWRTLLAWFHRYGVG